MRTSGGPANDPRIPDLINTIEAAAIIGVTKQAVHDMHIRGDLPGRRIGRHLLIRRSMAEKLARERQGAASDCAA